MALFRWLRWRCRPCRRRSRRPLRSRTCTRPRSRSNGSRDAAFVEALKTVLVRVSGQRDAAAARRRDQRSPQIRPALRLHRRQCAAKWASTAASVDELLSKAGLPIWGRERPATVVMFGVEEAGGAWRWLAADTPAREREAIEKVARERGLPLKWPVMDAQERSRGQLRFAGPDAGREPLWRERRAARPCAGRRQSSGRCSRAKAQRKPAAASTTACTWQPILSRECLPPRDLRSAASSSRSRASPISTRTPRRSNYLEGMTLVRGVALEQVAGDKMRFRLAVRGDAATLRRAIALDQPAGADGRGRWRCGGSARVPLSALSADAAHSQCALHPAHAAGRAGGLAAGRPTTIGSRSCMFAFAAATDGLDGFLAKRFGWTSELGKILDPLADKILLVGVFITLAALGVVPVWLAATAVAARRGRSPPARSPTNTSTVMASCRGGRRRSAS